LQLAARVFVIATFAINDRNFGANVARIILKGAAKVQPCPLSNPVSDSRVIALRRPHRRPRLPARRRAPGAAASTERSVAYGRLDIHTVESKIAAQRAWFLCVGGERRREDGIDGTPLRQGGAP
jgi:hypothetical protein